MPFPNVPSALATAIFLAGLAAQSNAATFSQEDTLRAASKRKASEERAFGKWGGWRNLSFTNDLAKSGITFEHKAVDDAAKNWIAAHYDHGSGMAAADVNGDGLPDLLFLNQRGGNALFINVGGGKFVDGTAAAGIALADRICVGAAFADIDNDGDPDLFITTVRGGNALFENIGNGRFKDISKTAGVDYSGHSSGAVFADVNRDGKLDLFVANVGKYTGEEKGSAGEFRARADAFKAHTDPARYEASLLYINQGGGKFALANDALAHSGFSGEASFCDLNLDGLPELYALSMQGDDAFYTNESGKFKLATAQFFPKTPWGAMGLKFFDFNNDGLIDLYVTDMHSDMTDAQTAAGGQRNNLAFDKLRSEQWCSVEWSDAFLLGASNNVFGNALSLNRGPGRPLEDVTLKAGAETYWPWGVSIGDLNADGFQDAFITAGMGYPFRYQGNSLLLNQDGKQFADVEYLVGIEPRANNRFSKTYFTLDADGADKDHPLAKGLKGQVPVTGSISSRSSVLLDIDGDGDLDIVTNEMNDHPEVFYSSLSDRQKVHRLQVRLQGGASNRDGLGATVKVTAVGREFTQFNDGKSGYLGQSSLPLYFGLGNAEKVSRIEIRWPSGKVQAITEGIDLGKVFTAVEP